MRVTFRRAALIAGTVAAVAGTVTWAAVAAPASAASWHIVKQVHNGPLGEFTAVTAVGRGDAWAFTWGSVPTAWRLSGSSWTQVPFPGLANEQVIAAGAVSASDVWAFTANGTQSRALRWNGSTWTVVRTFPREIGGAAVLGASDVWVFGNAENPGLNPWHFDGHAWSQPASAHGLLGGSGLSAGDVWAFGGVDVAHWNGSTWTRTSLASLLPAKQQFNEPNIDGIYAESRDNVYALGTGDLEDEGGPLVVLHWNGAAWSRVAQGSYGVGTLPLQQASPDGHGGLWIPMPGYQGRKSYLLHYSAGQLTPAALPGGGPYRIDVNAVAPIPGTNDLLAGGETHAYGNPGNNVTGVILQYGA